MFVWVVRWGCVCVGGLESMWVCRCARGCEGLRACVCACVPVCVWCVRVMCGYACVRVLCVCVRALPLVLCGRRGRESVKSGGIPSVHGDDKVLQTGS